MEDFGFLQDFPVNLLDNISDQTQNEPQGMKMQDTPLLKELLDCQKAITQMMPDDIINFQHLSRRKEIHKAFATIFESLDLLESYKWNVVLKFTKAQPIEYSDHYVF